MVSSNEKEEGKGEKKDGLDTLDVDPSGIDLTSGFSKAPRTRQEGILTKSPHDWMKSVKEESDIGEYWRVHDNLYDLTDFVDRHPGGKFWLKCTKGVDITEAFESAHMSNSPEDILRKYFVKTASVPKFSPFTFKDDGFYRTLKRKAKPILQGVDHGPTTKMKLIQDGLFVSFLSLFIYGSIISSYVVIFLAGLVLSLSTICAHNFLHQKDNWRMYMFDFSLQSSQDWRISHAMSHHLYPNTIQDYEVFGIEPFFKFYPIPNKNFIQKYLACIPLYPVYFFLFLGDYFRRGLFILIGKGPIDYPFLIQPILFVIMGLLSKSFLTAIALWCILHVTFTFTFLWIAWTGGHHSYYAYMECDSINKDKDWGLHQIIVNAERKIPMDNLFLTAISFGSHTLHHLFPTLDQSRLHLLKTPFLETCEEFGVDFIQYSLWQLITSMFYRFNSTKPNEMPVQFKFRDCRPEKECKIDISSNYIPPVKDANA